MHPPRSLAGHTTRQGELGLVMLPMMVVMAFPLLGIVLFFLLPPGLAVPVYLLGVGVAGIAHWLMMRSMHMRVKTGRQGMIGTRASVLEWHDGGGFVRCHGELWRARDQMGRTLTPGTEVEVAGLEPSEDMVLRVRPVADGADEQTRGAA